MLSHKLALSEVLVTGERASLVTNETTNGGALKGPVCEATVNIARRDKTRFKYTKKVQRDMIPLALGHSLIC